MIVDVATKCLDELKSAYLIFKHSKGRQSGRETAYRIHADYFYKISLNLYHARLSFIGAPCYLNDDVAAREKPTHSS